MKIIVGTTELTVSNCYPYRYGSGKLVLKIEIPKEGNSLANLETICEDIKTNASKVEVYNDDGEKEQVFSGFHYNYDLGSRGGQYVIEMENESESNYQIELLKERNAELENANKIQLKQMMELEEQLAIQDEVSIGLYEKQMEQEEVNVVQDEALIEIYEKIGGN